MEPLAFNENFIFVNDSCFLSLRAKYVHLANFTISANVTPLRERKSLHRIFFVAPLPMAIVSLIVNVAFSAVVLTGLRIRRLPFKLYSFLLARSLSDSTGAVAATALTLLGIFTSFNLRFFVAFDVLLFMTSWFSSCQMLSVVALKLISVARPLQCRKLVTIRLCLSMIGISSVGAAACAFLFGFLWTFALNPTWTWPIRCTVANCLAPIISYASAAEMLAYCSVLLLYFTTLVIMYRVQQYCDYDGLNSFRSKGAASITALPGISLRKLGVCMCGYAVSYFPLVTLGAIFFISYDTCEKIIFQWYSLVYLQGWVRIFLLIRAIVEPLVNFYIDRKLWLVIKQYACYRSESTPASINRDRSINSAIASRHASAVNAPDALEIVNLNYCLTDEKGDS
uniref:G-protein coupled receptors family 1 profile domain-containing protein n=1 Tax=Plectus sambesii TaxID=2011161 RepID=A0A914UKQ3_9BILA